MTSAAGKIVPGLGTALRRQEKRGTGAEGSPEQRTGGEDGDMLPVQLPVFLAFLQVGSIFAT
jgi:hypothetical protein